MTDLWIAIVATAVVYMALYIGETIWNFVGLSPPLMDAKGIGVRTRQRQRQLETARHKLIGCSEGERLTLAYILDHGEITVSALLETSGIGRDILTGALPALLRHGLIMQRFEEKPGAPGELSRYLGTKVFWVNPELKEAITLALNRIG